MQTNPEHTHGYTWALFKRDYSASCQLGTIEAEITGCPREAGPVWTHLATPLHRLGFSSLRWLQVISCFYLDTLSFAFTCSCFVTRFKDDRAGPVPKAARNRLPVENPLMRLTCRLKVMLVKCFSVSWLVKSSEWIILKHNPSLSLSGKWMLLRQLTVSSLPLARNTHSVGWGLQLSISKCSWSK